MFGILVKREKRTVKPRKEPVEQIHFEDLDEDFDFVPMRDVACDAVDYIADAFKQAEYESGVLITITKDKAIVSFLDENEIYVRNERGFWSVIPKVIRKGEQRNGSNKN